MSDVVIVKLQYSSLSVIRPSVFSIPAFFSGRELTFTFAICYRPSVCLLSVVCLSVTLVHPTQAVKPFGNFFSPYDSPGTLLFWCQKSLVGTPLSHWNLRSKWPTPFKTAQFRPISAHSASIVIASEKSSISTYRKSTTRFPTTIDQPCTLPLSPPKGGTKTRYRCLCQ